MDSGTVIGIVFGVIFSVIFLGFVALFFYKRRASVQTSSFDNPAYFTSSGTVETGVQESTKIAGSLQFSH